MSFQLFKSVKVWVVFVTAILGLFVATQHFEITTLKASIILISTDITNVRNEIVAINNNVETHYNAISNEIVQISNNRNRITQNHTTIGTQIKATGGSGSGDVTGLHIER